METLESIQKAADMVSALQLSLQLIKDKMNFAPLELSKAIGSLAEAERSLKITIAKLNKQ